MAPIINGQTLGISVGCCRLMVQGSVMGPIVDFQLIELSGTSSAICHNFCCVYCTDSKQMMSACYMVLKYCYIERDNYNYFVIIFKLEEDPYNEDVQLGLSKVEPAREDISRAKALVRGNDYKGAIELITKIIEVSNRK